jgi:hypothetical protein
MGRTSPVKARTYSGIPSGIFRTASGSVRLISKAELSRPWDRREDIVEL